MVRYADLIIASQPYGDGSTQLQTNIVESALFGTGAPVLIVPRGTSEMRAFERVMARYEDTQRRITVHEVVRWPYTIRDQQQMIFHRIRSGVKVPFELLFSQCENRVHAIVTFLALLELLNQQLIDILQGNGMNNFWLVTPEVGDELPDLPEEEHHLADSEEE